MFQDRRVASLFTLVVLYALGGCVASVGPAEDDRSGRGTAGGSSCSAAVKVLSHDVVQKKSGVWMMGPANGGGNQWSWGNEIVVSYTRQRFDHECPSKHNIPDTYDASYASPSWSRSLDGGKTWTHFNGPTHSGGPSLPIDFTHPGFGIKVPNLGTSDKDWYFHVTYDRWKTYSGPYKGLNSLKSKLSKKELTSRTDYIVNSKHDIFLFMSARDPGQWLDDYAFVARSTDGGKSFSYVSRINPWGDSARGVMPSAARLSKDTLVACLRRRAKSAAGTDGGYDTAWIDCFRSDNNGTSWSFAGKLDDTGHNNGNPPAMRALPNGLLACVYGVRAWLPDSARISLKVSADGGKSWNLVGEKRLRDKYHVDVCGGQSDASDLGYPRLFVLPGGQLRAVYAWSDGANENHISSTLFEVKSSCNSPVASSGSNPPGSNPPPPSSACNPATQPAPHWGVKGGVCLPSCGGLGGTSSSAAPCAQTGKVDAGAAFDVPYCCKAPSSSAAPIPAAVSAYLDNMYQQILKRAADAAGKAYWAGVYASTAPTCQGLTEAFLGAPASKAAIYAPASDAAFLSNLYQALLWRKADATGLNYWLGQLTGGTLSRAAVVQSFINSAEFASRCTSAGLTSK